ncbi:MAG: hypothetical protein ACWA5U_09040 [bacterium]
MISASNAYAGVANASFDCKSASGRTTVVASVPGDHVEHKVTFAIDGEKLVWKNETFQEPPYAMDKNSSIFVLGSMQSKNYHFMVVAPNSDNIEISELLRFSAVPASINVKKTPNGEKGTLSAIVQGQDPRKAKDGQNSPKIVLDCTYTFEI